MAVDTAGSQLVFSCQEISYFDILCREKSDILFMIYYILDFRPRAPVGFTRPTEGYCHVGRTVGHADMPRRTGCPWPLRARDIGARSDRDKTEIAGFRGRARLPIFSPHMGHVHQLVGLKGTVNLPGTVGVATEDLRRGFQGID